MLTISPAEVSEAEQLARLGQVTFVETFGDLFADHSDDLAVYLAATFAPAKIAASIAKPENRFWLARDAGVPIGYAKLKLCSWHRAVPGKAVGQLQKIYVLKERLGTGAGRRLHDAVLTSASEQALGQLWLTVLEGNARAIGFYESQGWIKCARDTHRIGQQEFVYDVLKLPFTQALP